MAEAILLVTSLTGERHQTTGPAGWIFDVFFGGTRDSAEDNPSNWIGIKLASTLNGKGTKPEKARLLSEWCGEMLSANEASRLFHSVHGSDRDVTNPTQHPFLFSPVASRLCGACQGAKESSIFDATPQKQVMEKYRPRIGGGIWYHKWSGGTHGQRTSKFFPSQDFGEKVIIPAGDLHLASDAFFPRVMFQSRDGEAP